MIRGNSGVVKEVTTTLKDKIQISHGKAAYPPLTKGKEIN